ncbi:MAG: redox-sensing transcriptional repressor Rex [Candidatus Omnitrophica bacterium]|nr:redox-sensing transcriptional repressor Rex [Candidatus Omnitrophota bacterium]
MKNKNSVIRLSRYKNALRRLKTMGFARIFSDNLADAIGVTPSQVRKDFSIFGISGNKRGGYQIDELIEHLNNILGKNTIKHAIIVGAGNIGAALAKYDGFEKDGIKIDAVFEADPLKVSSQAVIPVLHADQMIEFIQTNDIRIGIIAVPESSAQQVLDLMVLSGVKGVLNFAPIRLRAPKECVVNNVNLVLELENVIYFSNLLEKEAQEAEINI